MKLRGPGDFFGIRQSGLMEFAIGDIYRDTKLLQQASQDAAALLKEDPQLEKKEHRLLGARVERYMTQKLQDVVL